MFKFIGHKKARSKDRATSWNRIGDADSDGPQKGESGPTPGYSVFVKHFKSATYKK